MLFFISHAPSSSMALGNLDYFPVPVPFTEFNRLSSFHIHLCLQRYGASWLVLACNSVHGMPMLIFISHSPSSSMAWCILIIFLRQIHPGEFGCLSSIHFHLRHQWRCLSWFCSCSNSVHKILVFVAISHPPLSSIAWCILIVFLYQFRVRSWDYFFLDFPSIFVFSGIVYLYCLPVTISSTECSWYCSFYTQSYS